MGYGIAIYKLGRNAITTEKCVVLVISPLVPLMADQMSSIQAHGVGAAILSGNAGINKVC
jgi:superfamily II DNA helicase RecQ